MLVDEFDDIGDGQGLCGFVAVKLGRKRLFERGKRLGTRQAVKAEVDLEIHRRVDDLGFAGVLFDRRDDGLRRRSFEQFGVFGRELPGLDFFCLGGDDAGFDLFFKLKTLDLVGRRSRQRLDADHVIADALIFRQLAAEIVEGVADRFLRVGHASLL